MAQSCPQRKDPGGKLVLLGAVIAGSYINTNEMPNHFTLTIFFAVQGAMYHVAIATVLFSHVKITCYFHM